MLLGQRDSVGASFAAVPAVVDGFIEAITDDPNDLNLDLTFGQFLGITNTGNFCYRNAVLTAFLSLASVTRYLILWHFSISHDENSSEQQSIHRKLALLSARLFGLNPNRAANQTKHQIQASVDNTVEQFWWQFCYERNGQGVSLAQPSPDSWRAFLQDADDQLEGGQQDAHEFLTWLMDTMPKTFNHAANPTAPFERFDWVFKSRIVNRVMCERCKYPVRRRTPYNQESTSLLMLNIPSTSHNSAPRGVVPKLNLSDLIDDALYTEIPELRCTRCKEESNCMQEKRLQHAPALLMLVISRGSPMTGNKNASAVMIPDQLDVSPHLNVHEFGEGSSVTYLLSSVVSHAGAQMKSGHYISYIRGGKLRDEWAELNDKVVTRVKLADFDDSGAADLGPDDFERRPTPYILFYERSFATDMIVPGRQAFNVNEGNDKDERPTHWTGGKDFKIKGAKAEGNFPPAVLQVTVTIGDIKIELPRHVISHLNWNKRRTVKIDARLRVPRGKRKRALDKPDEMGYVEASLSDIQNQEYHLEQRQREGNGERVQKKRKTWQKNWRDANRESIDLTQEETKMLADASGATRTIQ